MKKGIILIGMMLAAIGAKAQFDDEPRCACGEMVFTVAGDTIEDESWINYHLSLVLGDATLRSIYKGFVTVKDCSYHYFQAINQGINERWPNRHWEYSIREIHYTSCF